MMTAILAAACALSGGMVGWFFIPWAADMSLRRVRQRSDAWWGDSLKAYEVFKRESQGKEPQRSAKGVEGALGIWREDACREALAGRLSRERLDVLEAADITVAGLAAYGSERQRAERYSFHANRWQRAFFAVALCLIFSAITLFSPNVLAQGALSICALAMMVTVVCDLRARTIPLEACFLVAFFGALFQVSIGGAEGLVAGAAFALFLVAGVSLANRLMRARCPEGAVGRGDLRCMGALALATGGAALGGFAACYLLAGLGSLVGCATKRLTWTSGIPMAPFLAVWWVVGSVVCLL